MIPHYHAGLEYGTIAKMYYAIRERPLLVDIKLLPAYLVNRRLLGRPSLHAVNFNVEPLIMAEEKEPQVNSQRQAAGKTVAEKYADVTLRLVEDHGNDFGPLTPEKETKLRRKLYLHIMVLVSAVNFMLFVGNLTP